MIKLSTVFCICCDTMLSWFWNSGYIYISIQYHKCKIYTTSMRHQHGRCTWWVGFLPNFLFCSLIHSISFSLLYIIFLLPWLDTPNFQIYLGTWLCPSYRHAVSRMDRPKDVTNGSQISRQLPPVITGTYGRRILLVVWFRQNVSTNLLIISSRLEQLWIF